MKTEDKISMQDDIHNAVQNTDWAVYQSSPLPPLDVDGGNAGFITTLYHEGDDLSAAILARPPDSDKQHYLHRASVEVNADDTHAPRGNAGGTPYSDWDDLADDLPEDLHNI